LSQLLDQVKSGRGLDLLPSGVAEFSEFSINSGLIVFYAAILQLAGMERPADSPESSPPCLMWSWLTPWRC
jgi:hypothetical protein